LNRVSQDRAYSRLKDYLTASTGLTFPPNREKELAEFIGRRLADLRMRDCSSYAEFLAGSAGSEAELDVLVEHLTIGETYFFRDPEQFAAIRDIIIPDIMMRKQFPGQLRIWSAGCATGAEPYSLALLLARELSGLIAGRDIEIFATDLNRICLTQAAEGKFRTWALRATSDEVKRECFSNDGPIWTIHPRFKQWISFHYMNLAASDGQDQAAGFDLILCRNVMIYFTPEECLRLIGRLHQSLADGGWLIVGAAEYSADNYKAFRTVNADGAMLYQKMAPAEEPPAPQPVAVATIMRPDAPVTVDVEVLRKLADRGDWQGAAECGRRLLALDKLNPAIHFYQGLIFEHIGIAGESERSLRRAIYLDRNFALAHYHLGLLLKKDGRITLGARSFGNVLKVLACTPDNAIVPPGNEVTATGLKELAKMHLQKASGS
jgi:chemotaxis protein methyltransferase CheR